LKAFTKYTFLFSLLLACVLVFLVAYPGKNKQLLNGNNLPVTGFWNGFNGHMVVLECLGLQEEASSLTLTIKDHAGVVIGEEFIEVQGSSHVILNKFGIADRYGTVEVIPASQQSEDSFSCQIMTYRMQADGTVTYVTSSKFAEMFTGTSLGIFNSMNPDTNVVNPVYNWLSIYNAGNENFNATIKIFSQDGSHDAEKDLRVAGLRPGARMDYPLGHDRGQIVGIYEISPDKEDLLYTAFLSRYSEMTPGNFNFSMVMNSSQGFTDSGMVPASTMGPSFNWAELANITPETLAMYIEIFDSNGGLLKGGYQILKPYQQRHIFLNKYLGELAVGYFRVRSSGKIIAQSLNYGVDVVEPGRIPWAFNTSGGDGVYKEATFAVNTYLNSPNWLKIFALANAEGVESGVAIRLVSDDGSEISLAGNSEHYFYGSKDIPVHEFTGPDFSGYVTITSLQEEWYFQASLVRVYTGGSSSQRRERSMDRSMKDLSARNANQRTSFISTMTSTSSVIDPFVRSSSNIEEFPFEIMEPFPFELDPDGFFPPPPFGPPVPMPMPPGGGR
jgi:hypothetical protein